MCIKAMHTMVDLQNYCKGGDCKCGDQVAIHDDIIDDKAGMETSSLITKKAIKGSSVVLQ